MDLFTLTRGDAPLLISVPHAGLHIPEDIKARLSDVGRTLSDADWHVDRLYAPFVEMGATLIAATHHRTVIDLNRPRDGKSLYPGQATTGLCPTETFTGAPLYLEGEAPDAAEIEARALAYWEPYHAALTAELRRLRTMHHQIVLWDGHSINNHIPRLFEGTLPDFNFGTNDGLAARDGLAEELVERVRDHGRYSVVLNGRFKGGAITRTYGHPAEGVNAIQLEMSQSCYMDQATFAWDEEKAAEVQEVLGRLLALVVA